MVVYWKWQLGVDVENQWLRKKSSISNLKYGLSESLYHIHLWTDWMIDRAERHNWKSRLWIRKGEWIAKIVILSHAFLLDHKDEGTLFWWNPLGRSSISRLIQNKFFRILSNAERICIWVFKAYFVKKKNIKCISSENR